MRPNDCVLESRRSECAYSGQGECPLLAESSHSLIAKIRHDAYNWSWLLRSLARVCARPEFHEESNNSWGDAMIAVLARSVVLGIFLPVAAFAHHSTAGRYDTGSVIEIDGEVTQVLWRNPHAYVIIETTDDRGDRVSWELETNGVAILQRNGVQRDSIRVGDHIRAAGYPPVTPAKEMYASNILLPNGEELLLGFLRIPPRWTSEGRSSGLLASLDEGDSSRPELGIFRVWSSTVIKPVLALRVDAHVLTEPARATVQGFDPLTDRPTLNCTPKGMPTIMDQPYPIEFVPDDHKILLRIEEYDTLRTIYMDDRAAVTESPLGHSVGRWEGATLVVTTTSLDWPWFNQEGIPQSKLSVLVEQFTPTEDGSRSSRRAARVRDSTRLALIQNLSPPRNGFPSLCLASTTKKIYQ